MDQDQFDDNKYEIIEYIKIYNNDYRNKTDGIAKIRFLGNTDDVFSNFRPQEMPSRSDLVDIENSNNETYDADVNDHQDEVDLLEKNNDYDIFIMFNESDNKLHTLEEVVSKDKEGNAKFPAWLPENNFTANSVIRSCGKYILRKRYLEDNWDNAFIVFVIYGEEELEEDKPITEASRIMLKETLNWKYGSDQFIGKDKEFIKNWWKTNLEVNSDLYDEPWFALVSTKAIRETINWDWISKEINKTETESE